MIITIGIYFFYWYYRINEEIQRFERDDSMSPTRSLLAMIFGWIISASPRSSRPSSSSSWCDGRPGLGRRDASHGGD
jgi:hypothetical protein